MRCLFSGCVTSLVGLMMMAQGAIAQSIVSTDAEPDPSTSQGSVDVPFTGEVLTACTFDIPEPGQLVPVGVPIAEVLTSLEAGGNPGQVNVLCNTESNLVVNEPVQTDGPSVVTTAGEALVDSPVGNTSSNGTSLTIPAGVNVPLTVDMSVRAQEATTGFPPGIYRYKVTLVVTP